MKACAFILYEFLVFGAAACGDMTHFGKAPVRGAPFPPCIWLASMLISSTVPHDRAD